VLDDLTTIASILTVGASTVALLALANRAALARRIMDLQTANKTATAEVGRIRRAAEEQRVIDIETISKLNERLRQQSQMVRSLQEDLDKFIAQHRSLIEIERSSASQESAAEKAARAAATDREHAIRERLQGMLRQFREVTGAIESHGQQGAGKDSGESKAA
jgi:hypothetical protein